MNNLIELSRDEMRNIKAGNMALEGCLYCDTPGSGPNGGECWYRDDIAPGGSNTNDICNGIYPAYDGNVSGNMGLCGSNCHMN